MSRKTRAIVVGVDGYAFSPLTSAVNDALAVCDALTRTLPGELRPLVAASDIALLATPAPGQAAPAGSRPATHDAILDALEAFYTQAETASSLFFYFAGHGLSGSRDGRVREPLIAPADVRAPDDGSKMICLDDLLALFAERGPLQQLWIIDACRDVPYAKRPRGYAIAWNEEPPQGPRAQAAIFAVAAGGKALSQRGGYGEFTRHLIAGLAGDGSAADYIPGRGDCVTAQSLHAYIHRRILASLDGYDEWTRTVQAPELRTAGPMLEPIRLLAPRPPRPLTIDWRPPGARDVVDVTLEVQAGIPVPGWPPLALPRVYELRAQLKRGMDEQGWGQPRPALCAVDVRDDDHVTIEVPRELPPRRMDGIAGPEPRPWRVTTDDRGVAPIATVSRRTDPRAVPGRDVHLQVQADDGPASVRLRRAEHPWTVRDREPRHAFLDVEPGTWDVEAMIGDEPIAATRVVLAPGETRILTAVAQITPCVASLLPEVLPASDPTPPRTVTMDDVGPMQGAILPTLLPLLALAPFDPRAAVLPQLAHLQVPPCEPAASIATPRCAVAVALEGTRPPGRPAVVADATCVWTSADHRVSVHVMPIDPQRRTVTVHLPGASAEIAAPQVAGGVTAVTVTGWPDGTVQASVGMFRLPLGLAWPLGDPESCPPGRLARALALAAPLFRAGADLQDAICELQWIEPVLGALAFHACRGRLRALPRDADAAYVASQRQLRDDLQANLARDFAALPDSLVIAALHDDPERQRHDLAALLSDPGLGQPVLAASVAELAAAARAARMPDHWSLDRLERIAARQVFNVVTTAAT